MNPPEIGTPEGQRLEFKGAASMRNPKGRRKIAKEVVAMLNAQGGNLWVGIAEDGDRMIGLEPFGEEDSHHEVALKDTLLDLIEPRGGAFEVQRVAVPGGWIVAISISPTQKTPISCLREGDNRLFVKRHEDRIRGMEFHEIHQMMNSLSAEPSRDPHLESLEKALSLKTEFIFKEGYFLFASIHSGNSEYPNLPADLTDRIHDFARNSCRQHGWSFPILTPSGEGEAHWVKHGKLLVSGIPSSTFRLMEISKEGWACFSMGIENLQWGVPVDFLQAHPTARGLINPLPFIEYTNSAVRILPILWPEAFKQGNVEIKITLALNNVRGWVLPPYAQDILGYHHPLNPWKEFQESKDLAITKSTWASSVDENPDAVTFQLVEEIYREFGHDPKVIPFFKGDPPQFFPPS